MYTGILSCGARKILEGMFSWSLLRKQWKFQPKSREGGSKYTLMYFLEQRVEYTNWHKSQHFAKKRNEVEILSLVWLKLAGNQKKQHPVKNSTYPLNVSTRISSFHTPGSQSFIIPVPPQTQHRAAKTDIKSPCILWIHIGHGPEQ